MAFPLGVRFSPSDEEKIQLLLLKVTGNSVPSHSFIGTCDLYGDKEPWEIFGESDEQELYFFTVLKKVGKKKNTSDYKRFSRNIGKGTWSNKGKTAPIHRKRKRGQGVFGYKKSFRYERKKEGGDGHHNGGWLLKEYSLPDNLIHAGVVKQEYKDCVLCVLKRKGTGNCADVESPASAGHVSNPSHQDDDFWATNTASAVTTTGGGDVNATCNSLVESRGWDLDHVSNSTYDVFTTPTDASLVPLNITEDGGVGMGKVLGMIDFNVDPVSNTAISNLQSHGWGQVSNSMDDDFWATTGALTMTMDSNTTTRGGDMNATWNNVSNSIYDGFTPPTDASMVPLNITEDGGVGMDKVLGMIDYNVDPVSNTAISDLQSRGWGQVSNGMDDDFWGTTDALMMTMGSVNNNTTGGGDHGWDDATFGELMSMINSDDVASEVIEIH